MQLGKVTKLKKKTSLLLIIAVIDSYHNATKSNLPSNKPICRLFNAINHTQMSRKRNNTKNKTKRLAKQISGKKNNHWQFTAKA